MKKFKVYYKIKNNVMNKNERGGYKRGFIKLALENYLKTISHCTNYPSYDSKVYHTKIESDILMKNLGEFKSNLFELERLKNESLVGVRK